MKSNQTIIPTNKTGGRPSKSMIDKYTKVVSTKLTELQYYAIRNRALQAGLSLSDYIRQAIINGTIIPRLTRQEAEILRQLAGAVNNLNQLARQAYTVGFTHIMQNLIELKDQIRTLINRLSDDWKNNQG